MNYIGSKRKLAKFIKTSILNVVDNTQDKVFCDLFAGTGIVGQTFKKDVKQIIANDIEPYSYALIRNYIGNHQEFPYNHLIDELNALPGETGLIFKNYCLGSGANRQYFSDENGQKIDAIRIKIEEWLKTKRITSDQHSFLLASLIENADSVANTASVYAAFLKHLKQPAQQKMVIKPALFECTDTTHIVYREDANKLIKKIKGDILYLDPPYNTRQYGNYYHILNTISEYKELAVTGITGMRDYYKSIYCKKKQVAAALEKLIKNAGFKYIFLSYNNEGLMTAGEIKTIMQKYGKYALKTKNYQRFKADKDKNRTHTAVKTIEYLHILTR
jgi:adenine-specific DNA-methyltransferase